MNGLWLILIIPITLILGCFIGVSFVDADVDITMDDNTRLAIESLNESVGAVPTIEATHDLLHCKDELLNETKLRYEVNSYYKECEQEKEFLMRKYIEVTN
jgi:uncharacterized protein YneF (UPF0154 family)